jgi:hypothetical protein
MCEKGESCQGTTLENMACCPFEESVQCEDNYCCDKIMLCSSTKGECFLVKDKSSHQARLMRPAEKLSIPISE